MAVRHAPQVTGCRPLPEDRPECAACQMRTSTGASRDADANLPFQPPLQPMFAKLARSIPDGDGWLFEPKWDGFRCIVFRDGDRVELISRKLRPLGRYFPELHRTAPRRAAGSLRRRRRDRRRRRGRPRTRLRRAAAAHPSGRVAGQPVGRRDAGRVRRVRPAGASATPRCSTSRWRDRRAALVDAVDRERRRAGDPGDHRSGASPTTGSTGSRVPASTASWPSRSAGPYEPGKRALVKVKHQRTADCAVAGYRIHKDGNGVGSLLLGLFDADGEMHSVGVAASFSATRRAELLAELEPRTRPTRSTGPPVAADGPNADGDNVGRSDRRRQPVERRQGSVVRADPDGTGRRGVVRAARRAPLPSRRRFPAVAARSDARVVHVRSTRRGRSGLVPTTSSRRPLIGHATAAVDRTPTGARSRFGG